MMRLIDADALMGKLYDTMREGETLYSIPQSAIDNAPTVDAVQVVRCKNCKYKNKIQCPMLHDTMGNPIVNYARDNDFCSYGEKKKGIK